MEDGEKSKKMEKRVSRQLISGIFNVSPILQSFWIRCSTIFPSIIDREFMESELRFVLYCGIIFWVIFILSKII